MTNANARTTAAKPQAPGQTHRRRAAATLLPHRPYPGLRPFEKPEWPIFRGRDRLIQDILTILAANHFVSIIGPSGSGKSSLVRAGVLATLERRHSRMGVRWRTGTMRPGASPLWSMADGILRALHPEIVAADGELPAAEVARLRVLIDASEDGLATAARDAGLEEDENFLLLVDQFEEIFRYRADHEDPERTRLIEVLLAVANRKPPGIHIITTMRSEYLGDCSRFKGLAETLNETHYLLPGMTEDELRQAILEPAEIKEGYIEEALVERLIEDIRGQEDQLPILQHTLLWMWIQEEERQQQERPADDAAIRLGLVDYEQLETGRHGVRAENVKNALSQHGNRILEGMPPEERRVAEIMFRRMVEVEDHSNRLRRPTQCGTVARLAQVSLEVVQRVVDAFRAEDASFIYASRRRVTDDTSIDIMHESLIRQWDTLDRWVRREKASYEVYNDLCRATQRMGEGAGTLLTGLALSRAQHWLYEEQPTRLWGRRYGGEFDAAIRFLTASEEAEEQRLRELNEAEEAARRQEEERVRLQNELEQQALRARLEEETRRAKQRRWVTAMAAIGACVCLVFAGYAFLQKERADVAAGNAARAAEQAQAAAQRADQEAQKAREEAARADAAAIDNKAGQFWYRLQLFGDPLKPEDVATLWDLTEQDDKVLVAFVRQLATDHRLLRRFGFNPQPIARAIGLRWPDEARETVKQQSVAYVASEQFQPDTLDPFELAAYTRAVAVLAPHLDKAVADAATQNIARAINGLAGEGELTGRQLSALAEMVGFFGERLEPEAIQAARDRLRREIATAKSTDQDDWGRRGLGRAIEVTGPYLSKEERLQAVRYLVPLLGQGIDSRSAKSIPRVLGALLPLLDADQAIEIAVAVPPAIARAAVAKADQDGAYLLSLMQLVEALARIGDPGTGAAFGQALAARLSLPNEPRQHAMLVRAAVPLLATPAGDMDALVSSTAGATLVPEQTGADLETAHQTLLRQAALRKANDTLRQALAAPDREHSKAALELLDLHQKPDSSGENRKADALREDREAAAVPGATPTSYRRAAQVRLAAILAPSLPPESALLASANLLTMLSDTKDYLTREAIAQALVALAPKLPDFERHEALAAAKIALAKTGSADEATAWARAVAALLPADPRAATAEIVEALKYPTATGASSGVLLEAAATSWPNDQEGIIGKTLPNQDVVDWLEDHLAEGRSLTGPPPRPPGLESADPGPAQH